MNTAIKLLFKPHFKTEDRNIFTKCHRKSTGLKSSKIETQEKGNHPFFSFHFYSLLIMLTLFYTDKSLKFIIIVIHSLPFLTPQEKTNFNEIKHSTFYLEQTQEDLSPVVGIDLWSSTCNSIPLCCSNSSKEAVTNKQESLALQNLLRVPAGSCSGNLRPVLPFFC